MVNLATVISHFPRLRAIAYGPLTTAPAIPNQTGHHCFTKTGPDGEHMMLVLGADIHRAVETVSTDGKVTEETTTPLGGRSLAFLSVWYAERCAAILAEGWQPSTVTPPLEVPPHP
ncbi:hypothetical protein [Microbispora sp. CA-102843]|uniref:hypothetical protein n=1 Tax=Microbispora sp. CA-102843 TaxID=3239952 RepID=UPI003D94178E